MIQQLELIDRETMKVWANFLTSLKETPEDPSRPFVTWPVVHLCPPFVGRAGHQPSDVLYMSVFISVCQSCTVCENMWMDM